MIDLHQGNSFYWRIDGRPRLLLGGSIEDNLFQIPDLEEHLDLLVSVGGDYVRGTISSRDEGNVWPHARTDPDGLYDLNRFDPEYWRRFDRFIDLTEARKIVVQIEIWDRFDYARQPWEENPFNPRNNINYTAEGSGLKMRITSHPGLRENAFFRSIPACEDRPVLLKYQKALVDRILQTSLGRPYVLFCISNETNEPPAWSTFWADYLHQKAGERGVPLHLTEMWDPHDLADPVHEATWKDPQRYTFCDISQNNHRPAHDHWSKAVGFRKKILKEGPPRPINSVKVYGSNAYRYGTTRDAIERFWRNIFAGLAAVRFHRPPTGLGLGDLAQAHIRSARMFTDRMNHLFAAEPTIDVLANRSYNEAYALACPGREYAVFFPDGGDVMLDVEPGRYEVHWMKLSESRWLEPLCPETTDDRIHLPTPEPEGYWAALIRTVAG
ncbi:MAG: hypothetical protein JJU36_07750 [Phycisphaeraceae bacterium]|nr:hypothetical protein [Phycisphaeraceae bacterium]